MTLWWPLRSRPFSTLKTASGALVASLPNGNDSTHRDSATTPAKRINRKKVARLMRAQNLFGFQKKRRVKTAVREKGRRVFKDLVNRDFTACAPNRVLVGNITYLPIETERTCTWQQLLFVSPASLLGLLLQITCVPNWQKKPSKTLPTCEEVLTVRFSTQITEASTPHQSSRQHAGAWA